MITFRRASVEHAASHQGPRSDATFLRDRRAEEARARAHRRHREIVAIPRLRLIGSALLLATIAVHNTIILGAFDARSIGAFALLQLTYVLVSQQLLARYYRDGSRFDLSTLFLAADVAVFVLAIHASGGEKSWLLPLLCVRVADQLATSQRRAFVFATWTVALHILLVLYMAFIERRVLRLDVELAKVGFVYLLNVYLSLAAAPAERQRKRASRMTDLARDLIDELAEKARQLEVERERAEAASRAKGTFLANMSHEIRTPLNAVLGTADLLLDEPLPARQREMVQTIGTSGRSLLQLINEILDMSKVEAGQIHLESADIDVRRLVEAVVSPMGVLARAKKLELHAKVEGFETYLVRGDELRLRQVLLNLVGNAIKFTERGQVTVRVQALEEVAARLSVRFSVQDTGIGMTPEAATRVFEAFQQADESTTRKFGGTGLGLSISKALVELMGGLLTVTTELGRGSCFELTLSMPCVRLKLVDASSPDASSPDPSSPDASAPDLGAPVSVQAEPSPRTEGQALAKSRVLIAEDTDVNRVLLQKMLERKGCEVVAVHDGGQALAQLTRDHGFDLVFMDWHMPVLDGIDATARVRAWEHANSKRHTPIVGFTASAFASEIERCKQAGMDDVLNKPVVRAQLEAVLTKYAQLAQSTAGMVQPQASAVGSRLDSEAMRDLIQMEVERNGFLPGLIQGFMERAPQRLQDLAAAIERGDAAIVERTAHSLRGSAGAFGAKHLAVLSGAVEQRAARGELTGLGPMLDAVRDELDCVVAELRGVLDELPESIARLRR